MISLPILILLSLAGFYLGWNIGANDGGNCIGTSIGAGLVSFRRGAYLVAGFALLGALLQGQRVVGTVGRGIVSAELPVMALFLALVSGGLVVSLATFRRIPVSTSQAVVGGLVGAGLSRGEAVNFHQVGAIALSWILCPLVALVLGVLLYVIIRRVLRRIHWTPQLERLFGWLVLASACYAAFSLGANNVGNAVGNCHAVPCWLLLLIGGSAIAVGVVTFGRGVAESIGRGIVPLDLVGALAAQAATGFAVHLYALLGIPVSTSHAIVGAVVGIGLVRGIRAVGRRKIAESGIGWIATPTVAGLLCLVLTKVFVR
jgi:PiT family inorganic phosphate transporter